MKHLLALCMLMMFNVGLVYAQSPIASLSVSPVNGGHWPAQFRLALTVPQDHHAYLDAGDSNAFIPVRLDPNAALAASGFSLNKRQQPVGVRDDAVKATVLRGTGEFVFELTPNQAAVESDTAQLAVTYQLCNDLTHVCFRPKTSQVVLPLPDLPVTAPAAAEAQASDDGSLMGSLVRLFQRNQGNTLIMFGLLFVAGLLSVATPCVYPMLPITSVFIVNRAKGKANKEWQHALAYWLGMVGTYMVLGLLAGMTGGAFNALMQSAAINLGFAVFFAFFALSLLGFYELSFLQNEVNSLDQHSSKVQGVGGTLLMGSVAGLVISPCVGPIVFALLLHIADTIAEHTAALALVKQSLGFWGKFAIATQGSVMMAGFGLGVGLPFFTIGIVKFKKLPKAGFWMNKIKSAFGLMILYFAYTYLQKALGVLGADSEIGLSLALGLVAVWVAVVHCQVLTLMPRDAQPQQKMQHFVGVVNLLVGGWLVVAGLGQIPIFAVSQAATRQTVAQLPSPPPQAANQIHEEAGIAWFRSFAAAQKVAQQTGKPLFIDFYASWCANCQEFQKITASNESLNKALREKAVAVKLVDQEPEFEMFRASAEHRPLKIGLPYFAILSPAGQLVWSGTDYQAIQTMVAALDKRL